MDDSKRDEIHIEAEDASAGTKGHGVRYVLAFGLIAALILLTIILIYGLNS